MTKKTDNNADKKFGAGITRRRVISVVALVLLAWGAWYFTRISARFTAGEAAWVRIPRSATPGQARDSIVAALGENFGTRVASLWNGDVEASHGAYRIAPGERAWQVARNIGRGRQTPVKVTFNNVRTLEQLAAKLAARMEFTAGDFIAACAATEREDSITHEALQAQFLPDTYELYWTDTPGTLIGKMRANSRRFWDEGRLAKAKALGLTPLQVSILGSIVEAESNRSDERPAIARLYINRLHRGMPLQADPTVKFATGDFAARRITAGMLTVDSPYNTYRVKGLPPGIIRYPEARTLDAVLDAPAHNYIYMCARPDGSGYHDFTADYAAHVKNARNYREKTFSKAK